MAERCKNYVGVTCVNGSCPVALREKYAEYGVPTVDDCSECFYYEGCEDCAMIGTDYCPQKEELGVKIPKHPILESSYKQQYYCPNCKEFVCNKSKKEKPHHCKYCRQILDWEGEE